MAKTAEISTKSKLSKILPTPTIEDPYAQLKFIFNRVADLKNARSTKGNIKAALSFYISTYLPKTHNYNNSLNQSKLFFLDEQWDSFALSKIETFFKEYNHKGNENRMSSYTKVTHMSAIRQVMEYAVLHQLTKDNAILQASIGSSVKETDQNTAYSDSEMDSINSMLQSELKFVQVFLERTGYEKTGVGRDPRVRPCMKGLSKGASQPKGFGWKEPANMRWYWENVMNCQALSGTPDNRLKYNTFFSQVANNYSGGLPALYHNWGVASLIDVDLLMPLAMKLALYTGMNPDSMWDLTVDCFQEKHPLTNVPYIKYFKQRSQGHMEMHLNIYDKNVNIRYLKESEANVIRNIYSQVLNLTSSVREKAPNELKNYLFIYQISGTAHYGVINKLNHNISSEWCRKIAAKYNLKSDEDKVLRLNIVRFRSTKISKMVKDGYDFFEIQSRCGHKSILQTLKYLAKNNLEYEARKSIMIALKHIHENRVWQLQEQPEYAIEHIPANNKSVIYKGIVADCRDVFSPPEEVQKLKNYQKGQACTRYNMCLFCKNVVIMKQHLPLLIIYKNQIINAEKNDPVGLPTIKHYRKTLNVIEEILDPKTSEFSKEELEWAHTAAECMDEITDTVVYRPIL